MPASLVSLNVLVRLHLLVLLHVSAAGQMIMHVLRPAHCCECRMQASQVGKNITTNELANWTRYKYLRGTDGTFHNPFDQGFKSNCIDVWYPDTAPLPPVAMDTSTSTMSLLKMEQGQQHLHDLSDCMH